VFNGGTLSCTALVLVLRHAAHMNMIPGTCNNNNNNTLLSGSI
jgi:hypothetical protein